MEILYHPGIRLEKLRKSMKNAGKNRRCPGQDSA
jgi:hypothetical protein